ncbi:MAG: phosphatase PAP2 family protein [Longimicrobiales bacterium]
MIKLALLETKSSKPALLLLLGLLVPGAASSQDLAPRPLSEASPASDAAPIYSPAFSKTQELFLTGGSVGLLLTGALYPIDMQSVPAEGFDPAEIAWSVDRDIVGNRDVARSNTSDWTRDAALLLPFVMGLAMSPSNDRWEHFGRRSAVYGEAFLLNLGTTVLLKTTVGRARPFAYLTEGLRPDDPVYDASKDRTFRSMPSGHTSTAWTGATLAMTEHLLSRPQASAFERIGVGFAAGTLASVTAALRTSAGQHFPSDVIAGTGIGVASGLVVPLLHRSETPMPTTEAWLQMIGGAVGGVVFGFVLGR